MQSTEKMVLELEGFLQDIFDGKLGYSKENMELANQIAEKLKSSSPLSEEEIIKAGVDFVMMEDDEISQTYRLSDEGERKISNASL